MMAADLRNLIDRAVSGLPLPPQLAQHAAIRYENRRRRDLRGVTALAAIAVTLSGLIVWVVIGATNGSNVGTVTPASPSHVAKGVAAEPSASPHKITASAIEVASRHEWFQYGDASLDPPLSGQAPPDLASAWKRIAAKLPGNVCEGASATTVQFGLFTNYLVVSSNPLRYQVYDYNKMPTFLAPRAPDRTPTANPGNPPLPQIPPATSLT
jgi:hypothetical protein